METHSGALPLVFAKPVFSDDEAIFSSISLIFFPSCRARGENMNSTENNSFDDTNPPFLLELIALLSLVAVKTSEVPSLSQYFTKQAADPENSARKGN
jgi:hypothetical protein